MGGNIAKTASSRPSHGIFCVVSLSSLVVNQSSRLCFLVTKKFDN